TTGGTAAVAAGACVVKVVEAEDGTVKVEVGGVPVAIPAPERPEAEIFSLPRDGKLLFGISVSNEVHLGYTPGEALWEVDCAHLDAAPVKRYAEDAADFGVAVASADGKALYYGRADGLGRLDLATMKAERIVASPLVDRECAEYRGEEGAPWPQRIFPERLDDAGLVVQMGAQCGYEGDWELHRYVVVAAEDPAARRMVPATRVSTLAVGPDGAAWLGDSSCDSFKLPEAGTDGAVWRSTDGGVSWAPLAIAAPFEDDPDGEARPLDGAVADVLVDAKDGLHVVVRSPICDSSAAVVGGDVLVTRDGGKTWARVAAPFESELDSGLGVDRVWTPDGSLDHLFAASDRGGEDGNDAPHVSESKDGGKTWQTVEGVAVPPPTPVGAVTVAGAKLEPGVLGVTRVADDGAREASFPPPNWRVEARPGVSLPVRVARESIGWGELEQAERRNAEGVKLARKGKLDEAIAAYTEALKVDPNHDLTRYNLACAHALAGRADEAMDLLSELSARGGYQALSALAQAPKDADLKALRERPEFRRITTVGALPSAFVAEDYDESRRLGFVIASDPAERMCVWATQGEDGEAPKLAEVDRVDCATGLSVGKKSVKQADIAQLDAWLQGLGMVAWEAETDPTVIQGAVKWLKATRPALAEATPEDLTERLALFRAPSGPDGRVAVTLDGTPPVRIIALASALRPSDGSP
ncbi:MAG: tetratricopeptide repeat protein, partial [Deltaproteobacteria bacterium]